MQAFRNHFSMACTCTSWKKILNGQASILSLSRLVNYCFHRNRIYRIYRIQDFPALTSIPYILIPKTRRRTRIWKPLWGQATPVNSVDSSKKLFSEPKMSQIRHMSKWWSSTNDACALANLRINDHNTAVLTNMILSSEQSSRYQSFYREGFER